MNNKLSKAERAHLLRVKELPCSVCDGYHSEAHHIKQGSQYLCVALCPECHRDAVMGWHGQKRAWLIRKVDMMDALNVTIRRLVNG